MSRCELHKVRGEFISTRGGLVMAARCKLVLGWGKEGDETGERRW
jgi:hypothetical protein